MQKIISHGVLAFAASTVITAAIASHHSMSSTMCPESEAPDQRMSSTMCPESEAPDQRMSSTMCPESEAPDYSTSSTMLPGSEAPDHSMSSTMCPGSEAPDYSTSSTMLPGSEAPNSSWSTTMFQSVGSTGGKVMGHVFVMTNNAAYKAGNQVVMYDRDSEGMLNFREAYKADGIGSGPAPTATVFAPDVPQVSAAHDGLGSQGSLIMNESHTCLIGVNAGSNSVFSFKIEKGKGLSRRSTIDSGGIFPNSLTVGSAPDWLGFQSLYILNAGEDGAIGRASLDKECYLYTGHPGDPIDKQMHSISLADFTDTYPWPQPGEVLTSPAQITLSPDEDKLLVTIKGGPDSGFAGRVVVFDINDMSRIQGTGHSSEFDMASSDGTGRKGPFSLAFLSKDVLALTHVNDHSIGLYKLHDNRLFAIGDAMATGTKFPCWIKPSSRGVIVGSFGELKPLDRSLLVDGPGIFSTFEVNEPKCMIRHFISKSRLVDESINGNHVIDFEIVKSDECSCDDDSDAREFLYAVQPRTGSIAVMEVKDGNYGSCAMNLKEIATIPVTKAGVNPNSETINDFTKRCYDYTLCEEKPPECMVSSIQGIVGF
ncbi:hypothetical protein [Endozoicomonas sp.]|uniref:hypothetical protein n=1 Tax=Endozoicomonas sp. TaxID=1892382 RepID=UPI00383A9BF3